MKDPSTGKRIARLNPQDQWIVHDVPDLRIVDDALWEHAHRRLESIREQPGNRKARETQFWLKRRPRHLLTGLIVCGCCGAPYVAAGRDYLACGHARRHGTCVNRRGIPRATLESLILEALKQNLLQPEYVQEFIREFHAEFNRLSRENEATAELKRRQLDTIGRKLDGLVDAIAEGLRTPGLKAKLEELEAAKSHLEAEIAKAPAPSVRLHPSLAEMYRRKVEGLHDALNEPASRTEAIEVLRTLVDRVVLRPLEKGMEVELIGEIANMVALGADLAENAKAAPDGTAVPSTFRSSVKVVAGAGFEPATFRL
ncbi:MAG: recombinase zinc beta ribbon domain-containing protein [Rhodospirillaceae bacterium]